MGRIYGDARLLYLVANNVLEVSLGGTEMRERGYLAAEVCVCVFYAIDIFHLSYR